MKAEAPKFGSPEWHERRRADLKRIADRARFRRPSSAPDSPQLRRMRSELQKLATEVATFGATKTADGRSIDQRQFELQQQIRAEEERLASSASVPSYASRAATAASARVPGEDDE